MNARLRFILAAALLPAGGCAHAQQEFYRPTIRPATLVDAAPTSRPTDKASTPLDQIEPRAILPATTPVDDAKAPPPPIQAVQLYARARGAILDRDRTAAIDLLQQAIALDPRSYELCVTLGGLYLTPTTDFNERSMEMLERAATIDGDHLGLQTDLGRQYMAKGNVDAALLHLRLATKTTEYATSDAKAAVAEFFLGNLLQSQGYDQAALEAFQHLSARLNSGNLRMRMDREVGPLLDHADAIDAELAELMVKRGKTADALSIYARLVARKPANFEFRAREVRLLLNAKRADDAAHAAEDAVVQFHASSDSVALLREAFAPRGGDAGATDALDRLHHEHPGDRNILYAATDLLRTTGKPAEALHRLAAAAQDRPKDADLLRRRVEVTRDVADVNVAAELLVRATADHPDMSAECAPILAQLARPGARPRLHHADVASLEMPVAARGAQQFWVSRLAAAEHRDDIATSSRAKALDASPPFPPAFRDALDEIGSRDDLDPAAKDQAARALIERAATGVNEALWTELRGLALYRQQKFKEAADVLGEAMRLGGSAPDLLMLRADALRRDGDDPAADALLWKLISDHPTLRDPYLDLYVSSIQRGNDAQAQRVLSTWLTADPQGVTARRMQAIDDQRAGRTDAAEAILVRLFEEHADDPEAVAALHGFYVRAKHVERFTAMLRARHEREPANFAVSIELAEALAAEHHVDEAAQVVNAARAAAGDDADLLYTIASVYARIGSKDASEATLRRVLALDPAHASAANDLGYVWAESGRNLGDAEALIRRAVGAEPHNTSFLDSMGWLLYKRGRFAEARTYLDRAIGTIRDASTARADPVLLDHRGDVLYRLGEPTAAAEDWRRAADQIAALHDDAGDQMKTLRLQLMNKADRQRAGQPVQVAPAEDPQPDKLPDAR